MMMMYRENDLIGCLKDKKVCLVMVCLESFFILQYMCGFVKFFKWSDGGWGGIIILFVWGRGLVFGYYNVNLMSLKLDFFFFVKFVYDLGM